MGPHISNGGQDFPCDFSTYTKLMKPTLFQKSCVLRVSPKIEAVKALKSAYETQNVTKTALTVQNVTEAEVEGFSNLRLPQS